MSSASECRFITEPDDSLKCMLCNGVAMEPWQHSSCGRLVCRKCLEVYGKDNPCQNCRIKHPRYFQDNKSQKEIQALRVTCIHVDQACEWEGTMDTLDVHVVSTCKFTLLPCPTQCSDTDDKIRYLTRKDLEEHLVKYCPNRSHTCEYCGEKDTYATITQVHDKICHMKMLPCPQTECNKTVPRQDINEHVKTECEQTVISCKYRRIGCDATRKRKDMTIHEEGEVKLHLHMALEAVSQLENTVKLLKEENDALKNRDLITFTLTDYQKKMESNQEFRSPSFYTGPKGYHMTIEVYVGGYGEGINTHLSAYAFLLKGRHDSELDWPFLGNVTLTLLNTLEDNGHFSKTINMDTTHNILVGCNLGYAKFIPFSKIAPHSDEDEGTQYLNDDALCFRVSVDVLKQKPWLECTAK